MGCYNDTGSEFKGAAVVTSSRALNGDFSYSNTSMTVDFCLRYCTQRGEIRLAEFILTNFEPKLSSCRVAKYTVCIGSSDLFSWPVS